MHAEGALLQFMEQALHEQRYADVGEIAALADGLAKLLNRRPGAALPARSSPESGTFPHPISALPPTQNSKQDKTTFPRFVRVGDKLVKVGWSKKNKSPYEHRAPREAVLSIARHLMSSVPEGSVFRVEELLPIPDAANGGELPVYQIHLTLAWLRQAGAIEKKGRDGYAARPEARADSSLDTLWADLPIRTA
jgi:hypothetical protein